jgi:hypothetical protein
MVQSSSENDRSDKIFMVFRKPPSCEHCPLLGVQQVLRPEAGHAAGM